MSVGEDKLIHLDPLDKVVLMCPPIPGTEKVIETRIEKKCLPVHFI